MRPLALATALLAGCEAPPRLGPPATPGPRPGGTFRFLLTEPRTLDPAYYEDTYQWQLMEEIFDGLVSFDPDLNVTPCLARTWTVSPDGLNYSFELREDAQFHNGRPLTAEDVAYSFLRAGRVSTGIARESLAYVVGAQEAISGHAARIEGLEVPDPHRVRLRLLHAFTPFLATLATPPFRVVPREEVEARGQAFGRSPVGSGPFRVQEWGADNLLVLVPHEAHAGGRPYLDRVEVRLGGFGDEVGPFLRGQVDRAQLARSDRERLPPGTPVVQRLELGTTCLGLNMGVRALSDVRVRRAIALALDREAIAVASDRVAVASRGLVPDGIAGAALRSLAPERDLDQARRLLGEAGYSPSRRLPALEFWANRGSLSVRAAAAIVAKNLAEIGIEVRDRTTSWTEFLTAMDSKALPLYLLTWLADTPDRDSYLGPLFHSKGATNYLHYADPEVDHLLQQAREVLDPMQRMRLYSAAEERINAASVLIPLFSQANAFAVKPGLQGFTLDAFGNTDLHRLFWASPQ